MCNDTFNDPIEALAFLMAISIGCCPHCGSVNLTHGVVARSCPARPFVYCFDCRKELTS